MEQEKCWQLPSQWVYKELAGIDAELAWIDPEAQEENVNIGYSHVLASNKKMVAHSVGMVLWS